MLGTSLAFQGDPGKGCESPREAEIGNGGGAVWFCPEKATELNVSFVLLCPGRWREVETAGGWTQPAALMLCS